MEYLLIPMIVSWLIIGVLLIVSWLIIGVFSWWFAFKAKKLQAISHKDLLLTWKLHRQQAECGATGLYFLRNRNHKAVGFRCECGYEFKQERLITPEIRKRHVSPEEPRSLSK